LHPARLMDLDTFHWLLGDAGQRLLSQATASDLSDAGRLSTLSHLRRGATPFQAAAAYETAWLRQRASTKFARAGQMYFTREALEQASGEMVGTYRASHFAAFDVVGDWCCSIGGDAIVMAAQTERMTVHALDIDPLRLAMAAENARAYGVGERIHWIEADLTQATLPRVQAAFFDPARRAGNRRAVRLADYVPPVELVQIWRKQVQCIGVKVAPGISDAELNALQPAQVEFISVDGDMKEATLWFGDGLPIGRRATLLRQGQLPITLDAVPISARPALSMPQAYVYEPDPAILRAHLVEQVALELGAAQLDAQIAYLTSSRFTPTRLARCWRVLDWLPFNLKPLRARLRQMDAGSVTVKKRGSPVDTDALAKQLSGPGAREWVVVLTQAEGRPVAMICEGPIQN